MKKVIAPDQIYHTHEINHCRTPFLVINCRKTVIIVENIVIVLDLGSQYN